MPRWGGSPGRRAATRFAATATSGVQRRDVCRTISRAGSATVSRNAASAPRNARTDWSWSPVTTVRSVHGMKRRMSSADCGSRCSASSTSSTLIPADSTSPGSSSMSRTAVETSSAALSSSCHASRMTCRYSRRNVPAATHSAMLWRRPSSSRSSASNPRSCARSSRSRSCRARPRIRSAGIRRSGQYAPPSSACPASSSRMTASSRAPVANAGSGRPSRTAAERTRANARECTARTMPPLPAPEPGGRRRATSSRSRAAASFEWASTCTESADQPAATCATARSTSSEDLPVPGPPSTRHAAPGTFSSASRSSPGNRVAAGPSHVRGSGGAGSTSRTRGIPLCVPSVMRPSSHRPATASN